MRHRLLRIAIVTATAIAAGLLATPTAAQAAPNPTCGPNIDAYSLVPRAADRVRVDGVAQKVGSTWGTASLYMSNDYVFQHPNTGVWEIIFWVWGNSLRAGDVVSLDWSDNIPPEDNPNRNVCHRTVGSGRTTITTPAINDHGTRWFRACLKRSGHGWQCSGSWTTN